MDPNGFLSLAEFDKLSNAGYPDGRIDGRDAIFSQLRLWIDQNHDGVAQKRDNAGLGTDELLPLSSFGIKAIELKYEELKQFDTHGNWLRFRAKIWVQGARPDALISRWAWDVILLRQS